jgi:hypothetical protein
MKLIVEDFDENLETIIAEDTTGKKKDVYIEGVFAQANLKNRNRRVYPKPILEKQITQYTENYVKKNRALGELNHTNSASLNPDRVSHKITELNWITEDNVWGKAKLTHTPKGNLVRNLVVEDGVILGVSTRGLGSVKSMNESDVVQNDYRLICWDVVTDPSAPDAFVNGIMEGKEWIIEDGVLIERDLEELQDAVNKSVRKNQFNSDFLETVFNNVIQKL